MEVKVDSRLIRAEREKRAWTQEHLAKASGLGLRTIHRIEATGNASFESVRALAAVFSLSVAELRAPPDPSDQNESPTADGVFKGLPLRLILAAISGTGCALAMEWSSFLEFPSLPHVVAGGLLFGGAVLCPYLKFERGAAWRAIALIGASSFSYFCAISVMIDIPSEWLGASTIQSPQAFLLASFVGASIVFVAARLIVPLRTTLAYWLFGVLASVAGGVFMSVADKVMPNGVAESIFAFAGWHVSMCLAIHFGRHSSSVARRVDSALRGPKTDLNRTTVGFVQVTYGR